MELLTLEWSLAGTRWRLFPWDMALGTRFGWVQACEAAASRAAV